MSRHPSAVSGDEILGKRAEAARYIAEMTIELRDLAQFASFDLLAHILDMAAEEAKAHSDHQSARSVKLET